MNYVFTPEKVFFQEDSLSYPLGQKLYSSFKSKGIPIKIMKSIRITSLSEKTPEERYRQAKRILAVTVKKSLRFATCKPSAHFQLPLSTSCPGRCEYCYLQTTLGTQPYLRVYVNLDQVLQKAQEHIESRAPRVTLFEASATSDPVALEPWTNSLYKVIQYFGKQRYGKLRFVTKFTGVDTLIKAKHNGNTHIRFSLNSDKVIKNHEKGTPPLHQRLEAAQKIARAEYPLGFILAPLLIYPGWEKDYRTLLEVIKKKITSYEKNNLTFELITHRFTKRAKNIILERFPGSQLQMEESKRQFKWGQFGYGKYLYLPEEREKIKSFFLENIEELFPEAHVEYFI